MKIAIVGSGTAGPAAAIMLGRDGHDVDVFERAKKKEAVGAGFLLQPTGMAVLESMGILEELLPHTARIDRLFWSVKINQLNQVKTWSLTEWKRKIIRITPRAENFLNQIQDINELQAAAYYDVRMKRWRG